MSIIKKTSFAFICLLLIGMSLSLKDSVKIKEIVIFYDNQKMCLPCEIKLRHYFLENYKKYNRKNCTLTLLIICDSVEVLNYTRLEKIKQNYFFCDSILVVNKNVEGSDGLFANYENSPSVLLTYYNGQKVYKSAQMLFNAKDQIDSKIFSAIK